MLLLVRRETAYLWRQEPPRERVGTMVDFLAQRRMRGLRFRASAVGLAVLAAALIIATCASGSSYNALDWGDGQWGQLGDNCDGPFCNSDRPVSPIGLTEVTGVSVRGDPNGVHSLAALNDGTVMGWGSNYQGQLGYEPSPPPYGNFIISPAPVPGVSEVKDVSAGGLYSLALLNNGTVMAWGANEFGQLGNGSTTGSYIPALVSGLSGVSAISAGTNHSLALLSNGTVVSWGANEFGQLGNGRTTGSDVPVAVSGLSGVTAVSSSGSTGSGEHSLALLSNGTVMSWGANGSGQLGNGSTTGSDVPVAVNGLSGVIAIAAGGEHSLALLNNGTVMAWGGNELGQLGNGSTTGSDVPVAVNGLSGVTAVSAGDFYSLALLSNAKLAGWGRNASGELGNGTFTGTDVPVLDPGLNGVVGISAGTDTSLAYGNLTYTAPKITSAKPKMGPVTGGTTVKLTGSNFSGATAVTFGSTSAARFTVNSDTSITAVSPALTTAGVATLTVTTPQGGTSDPVSFTFLPIVSGVSPDTGPTAGGTSVTITGDGFASGSFFSFGTGRRAIGATVNCISATTCTAVTPPHAAGTVDVLAGFHYYTDKITNRFGKKNPPADQFTYE
jgi:alpha-tubulin suppressor-like RCC1 family protein